MMLGQVIKQEKSTAPASSWPASTASRTTTGLQGVVSFSTQNHATVTQKQLTLVKYDAASKTWKPFAW